MFLSQLPSSFGIQIDPEAFLRSISMNTPEGRVTADQWTEAPSANVQNRFQDTHQSLQDSVLTGLYNRMVRGIPAICGPNPYQGLSISSNQSGRPTGESHIAIL